MTITAELHDGTRLEFPDGTSPEVIQGAVKKLLTQQPEQPEKSAPSRFLSGVGGEVLKAGSGIADMLPENSAHQWLKDKAKEGLDKATGFAGEAGKFVGATAPYMALPAGGILKTSAMSGALSGATTEGDIGDRALIAGTTGALTAAGGALIPIAKKAYDVASPIFTPQRNAVNKIIAELSGEGVGKLQAPNRANIQPDTMIGPAEAVFSKNKGVEATTAMLAHTDKALPDEARTALLKLEMNARLRSPEAFFNRDNANAKASYDTLEGMALPEHAANAAQDGINAITSPMREDAFNAALNNPTYRKGMLDYVEQKAGSAGFRASKGVPLINRARDALILKPLTPNPINNGISSHTVNGLESTAHPADLYTLKKELADSLRLKTISPDELTNAAKSDRRTAYEIMRNVDSSLNDSSGGKWDVYNKAYGEKIAPVQQGRAFQDIIDKFALSKPIYGTETPQLTARALRKAVADETYMNQGKTGYVSTIDKGARSKVNDVVKTINAIEQAKAGAMSTSGSQTVPFALSLAKSGLLSGTGGNLPYKALQIMNAIGVTRGARKLDEAMLNPDKLQPLIDAYNNRMLQPQGTSNVQEIIRKLTQKSIAGAVNE